MIKEIYTVTGMTCSACSARIEKTISNLQGVTNININLLKNTMYVEYDESILSSNEIISSIKKIGYGANLNGNKNKTTSSTTLNASESSAQKIKKRLIFSIILIIPLMYLAMGEMLHIPMPYFFKGINNSLNLAFTQLLFSLPILFINKEFFSIGLKALIQRNPNMDSLVAIGSGSAFLYGIFSIYQLIYGFSHQLPSVINNYHHQLYFESAGMILTLITVGKFLEARAKSKTTSAISKLMSLAPQTATKLENNIEVKIPVSSLKKDDILIIKAGETIPVDGIIIEGNATIDESMLTGEPLPVYKQVAAHLISGTLVLNGYLKMKAEKVGEDTTLAQIINLVDQATSSKAPIARLADKISAIFVPTVISISIISFIGWIIYGASFEFAFSIAIAVLVISCPCALGLATPTAIMVGTGQGALHGVLFKSAKALEQLSKINTLIFDKTGTITNGRPTIHKIILFHNNSIEDIFPILAALEKKSEHPLAKPIVKYAEEVNIKPIQLDEFLQIPGQGLLGKVHNTSYWIGNHTLATNTLNLKLNEVLLNYSNTLAKEGKIPLYFGKEKDLLAVLFLTDEIKPSTFPAIQALKNIIPNIYMITGDNKHTAEYIAKKIHIDNVFAEVYPADKANIIQGLQKTTTVAMVGDGINDAPALATADIGLAIGAGTDIAMDSADIILIRSSLQDVATAIKLSKAVVKNIKENLFWAFIYNIIGIPIAMGLFYPHFGITLNPMIAALAMSFSSVFVVSNALRLRFFKEFTTITHPEDTQVSSNNIEIIKGDDNMSFLSNLFGKKDLKEIKISISGMSCNHCVQSIEKGLKELPGIHHVKVDLNSKSATIKTDQTFSPDNAADKIKDLGFTVDSIDL